MTTQAIKRAHAQLARAKKAAAKKAHKAKLAAEKAHIRKQIKHLQSKLRKK